MEFAQYWQHTDFVSKFLFFCLFALSAYSWFWGITRILQSKKLAETIGEDLKKAISGKQADFEKISFEQKKTFMEQVLLQQIARFRFESERGLGVLGTTAAIAPFLGLFGTVWGIFHALHSIGKSGQAGLAQVAGPVGEALIMTGLGLAVAIPAVVFYNIAVRFNKKAMHNAHDTAHEVLALASSV